MLSCSVGSLRNRFPFAQPGRVGGRKGFCSRAIPGPGPSQNPALCGSPPTKGGRCCASILPPPRTSALDKEVVHVRCAPVGNSLVVAPVLGRSAAKDQAVGRAASLVFVVSTPRYGFAVFIYTCPLFLHTSAVVNHAGSVPKTDSLVGTQSRLRFCPSSTAPVGIVFPGLRPRALSLRFSVVTGRAGPDPGGRLCPQAAGLCRRPGAWGLPSVVPSKPVIPHALMLQTASGATLHSLRSFRAIGGL